MRAIYLIYDNKARDVVGIPMLVGNDQVAIREFADIVLHPQSQIGRHHEDYTLVKLGTFLPYAAASNAGDAGVLFETDQHPIITASAIISAAQSAAQAEANQP